MSEETQPDVTAGTEESAETAPAAPQPEWAAAYGSMVRFAAGLVGVAREGLDQAASAAQSADPAEELPEDESAPGSVLIGFAADLPNRFGGVAESVEGGTRLFAGTVSAGWRMLAASPVGRLAAMPVDAVRSIVDAESERLAAIGRHEVTQGRALVHSVVDDTFDGVIDKVSDNDALNELVKQQAVGITGAAIQEVRETGAAADGLTDTVVRKILRRVPRELPPRPAARGE